MDAQVTPDRRMRQPGPLEDGGRAERTGRHDHDGGPDDAAVAGRPARPRSPRPPRRARRPREMTRPTRASARSARPAAAARRGGPGCRLLGPAPTAERARRRSRRTRRRCAGSAPPPSRGPGAPRRMTASFGGMCRDSVTAELAPRSPRRRRVPSGPVDALEAVARRPARRGPASGASIEVIQLTVVPPPTPAPARIVTDAVPGRDSP